LPGQRLPLDRYAITLLRHPVDRLLSHYYFSRNHVPKRGGNATVELAKMLSLDEYVFSDVPEVRGLLENDQTMHFLPMRWDGSRELSPKEKLAAAKEALDQYDLVGAYEEFDDFVQVLACDLGIPPVVEVPRVNVTEGRAAETEIDVGTRRRLAELNELDIELYEHALSLFREKRRELLRQHAMQSAVRGGGADAVTMPLRLSSQPAERKDAPADAIEAEAPSVADFGSRRIEFISAGVIGSFSRDYRVFTGEVVSVQLIIRAHEPAPNVIVGIQIIEESSRIVFGSNCGTQGKVLDIRMAGDYLVEFRFRCDIGYGDYSISANLRRASHGAGEFYHWREQIAWLSVIGNVGDHWEGSTKLYPQITCESIDPNLRSRVALVGSAGRDTSQHLSDHAPLLFEFRGSVEPTADIGVLRPNEVRAIEMIVRNDSNEVWPSTGLQRVCASYRWLDSDRKIIVYDGERTPLPRDIEPGENLRLWVVVKAPPIRGTFTLSLTLLQEYYAWFDERGARAVERSVAIVAEGAVPEMDASRTTN